MIQTKPVLMGAIMAPMILWMTHDALEAGTLDFGWTAVAFAAAHVSVIGLMGAVGLWAASRNTRIAYWLRQLHRPTVANLAGMATGAVCVGGIIHLSIHGGLI